MSFLAAFALENFRVPDVPTLVVATASWGISAALLALCLHTIWEGGSISIQEKLTEVLQNAVARVQQLWLYQKLKSRKRKEGSEAGADVDATVAPDTDNVAAIELQNQGGVEDV